MTKNILELAAHNNAEWCSLVTASHGVIGSFSPDLWANVSVAPQYYPNFVTLTPTTKNLEAIAAHSKKINGQCSVKDSFDALNLQSIGFTKLFDAQWLEAPRISEMPVNDDIKWEFITSPDQLELWETAWSNGDSSNFFNTALLDDDRVRFIAATQNEKIIAGAIANSSDGIVGISNLFYPDADQSYFWHSLCYLAEREFPNKALVDYEHGDALTIAVEAGLKPLGPLSVWIKD